MSYRFAALLAGALGLAAAAGPAVAQPTVGEVVVRATPLPGVEVRSKVVPVADLDLTRSEGIGTALGRIRGAAREVCTPLPSHPANLADVADYDRCMTQAMDGGVAQVHNAMLEDLYARVYARGP